MAVELKFSKPSSSIPWGFRLVGGREFDQPLVVVKVNDDSIAENAGLEEGDIVVRINNTPTAGITHAQAHELLNSAGLNFVLGVRKGAINVHNLVNVDDDYETTFAELVNEVNESIQTDIIMEAKQRINREKNVRESVQNIITENLAGQEQIMYTDVKHTKNIFNESLIHGIKKDKKWSTFLMKPDKPVLEPKRTIENRTIEDEGYKVVIKKLPRKRFAAPEKKVQFDQNVVEVQINDEPYEDNSSPESLVSSETYDINDNEREYNVEDNEKEQIENEEIEEIEETEKTEEEYPENYFNSYIRNNSLELYKPISEIKVDEESSMTLEEQLRAVQKQLQTLSQLPSSIQLTLDAVSKQLAEIVGTNEENQNNNDEEHEKTEEGSVSEKAEAEAYQNNCEDTASSIGEEFEEDIITDEIRAIMERSEREDGIEDHEAISLEEDIEAKLREEEERQREEEARLREEEVKRQEEERLAKKQKAMEERPKSIQRPIILPGGRKWSNPDDAIPIFRKPKMSEEKIYETIESNLEPIVGNRKGINFLKYQPPPKNLDHLQRSEVYRLVHDMEPPAKGIVSRAEKIPAVQDYYEALKYSP